MNHDVRERGGRRLPLGKRARTERLIHLLEKHRRVKNTREMPPSRAFKRSCDILFVQRQCSVDRDGCGPRGPFPVATCHRTLLPFPLSFFAAASQLFFPAKTSLETALCVCCCSRVHKPLVQHADTFAEKLACMLRQWVSLSFLPGKKLASFVTRIFFPSAAQGREGE